MRDRVVRTQPAVTVPSPTPQDVMEPVTLKGRRVHLRPVSRQDYPAIYDWRTDPRSLYLWSAQRKLASFEECAEELDQLVRSRTFLLVVDRFTQAPIGFVHTYNTSPMDGYTYFLAFLIEEARNRGLGAEVVIVFLDYLFTYFPFRKVYAEVYDFNTMSLQPLLSGGFREEGTLRQHSWYGDRHWDLHVLALSREEWLPAKQRFRRVLRRSAFDVPSAKGDGQSGESGCT